MTTTTTELESAPVARSRTTTARLVKIFNLTWRYAFGVLMSLVILTPIVYAFLSGFKTNGELVGQAGSLFPSRLIWDNYSDVLGSEAFWTQVKNSVVVAVITLVLVVTFAALAAFVLARFAFKGREAVYTFFTLGLLFPSAAAVLPLFVLIRTLGLIDSPLAVALPQAAFGLPLTIVILRPFFRSIPNELEDAAKIDGCSTFGFFWRVLLPLSRPALATVAVLALVASWNAYLLPLLMLNSTSGYTLPLGTWIFFGDHSSDWAKILSYTSLSMLPAILLYVIAERQIVSGLTAGSVKG